MRTEMDDLRTRHQQHEQQAAAMRTEMDQLRTRNTALEHEVARLTDASSLSQSTDTLI